MSSNYSANQYESAFRSERLQNWCETKTIKKKPTTDGHTTFIANDRGHLLPGLVKRGSAWPDFKGTWDLPARIPARQINPTARSAEGLHRLKSWGFDPQQPEGRQPLNSSRTSQRLQDDEHVADKEEVDRVRVKDTKNRVNRVENDDSLWKPLNKGQGKGEREDDDGHTRALKVKLVITEITAEIQDSETHPTSQNHPVSVDEGTAGQNHNLEDAVVGAVTSSTEEKQDSQVNRKKRPSSQHSVTKEVQAAGDRPNSGPESGKERAGRQSAVMQPHPQSKELRHSGIKRCVTPGFTIHFQWAHHLEKGSWGAGTIQCDLGSGLEYCCSFDQVTDKWLKMDGSSQFL